MSYDETSAQLLRENKELTARIAELERRNAMLSKSLTEVLPIAEWGERSYKFNVLGMIGSKKPSTIDDSKAALSATSADTEAWLQAEILKRLGEPVGYCIETTRWNGSRSVRIAYVDEYLKAESLLYRLPSPLATPEERKE